MTWLMLAMTPFFISSLMISTGETSRRSANSLTVSVRGSRMSLLSTTKSQCPHNLKLPLQQGLWRTQLVSDGHQRSASSLAPRPAVLSGALTASRRGCGRDRLPDPASCRSGLPLHRRASLPRGPGVACRRSCDTRHRCAGAADAYSWKANRLLVLLVTQTEEIEVLVFEGCFKLFLDFLIERTASATAASASRR